MDRRAPLERIADRGLDAELRDWRRPTSGAVADTYVLELAGGSASRAVCKLGGASVWTGEVIEPLAVEAVRERTDLPVPAVLASGRLEPPHGALDRWACYEFRPGHTPGSEYAALEPAVRRRLVAGAGALLGRLHAADVLAVDRVCGLGRDDGTLVPRDLDGFHAVEPGPLARSLPVPLAGDPNCRPVFTHGDYGPGNLLIDESGAITAVLDWGNAHVTNAEYALARAEARFVDVHRFPRAERSRLRRTFRAGYRKQAPLPDAFSRRAPVYKGLWVAQSVANYVRIGRSSRGRTQLRRQLETAFSNVRRSTPDDEP